MKSKSFNGFDSKDWPSNVLHSEKGDSDYLYIMINEGVKKVWYAGMSGKVFKVPNRLYVGFAGNCPHFAARIDEHGMPNHGIAYTDCTVLAEGHSLRTIKENTREYSIEDLQAILGSFKLVITGKSKEQ